MTKIKKKTLKINMILSLPILEFLNWYNMIELL
jgi:hypothetical protein